MQNNPELVHKTPIDARVVIPEVACATSFGALTQVNVDPSYYGQRMHESGIGNREIRTTTLLVGSPCNSVSPDESINYDQKDYYCDLPERATIKASICYGRIQELLIDGKEKSLFTESMNTKPSTISHIFDEILFRTSVHALSHRIDQLTIGKRKLHEEEMDYYKLLIQKYENRYEKREGRKLDSRVSPDMTPAKTTLRILKGALPGIFLTGLLAEQSRFDRAAESLNAQATLKEYKASPQEKRALKFEQAEVAKFVGRRLPISVKVRKNMSTLTRLLFTGMFEQNHAMSQDIRDAIHRRFPNVHPFAE